MGLGARPGGVDELVRRLIFHLPIHEHEASWMKEEGARTEWVFATFPLVEMRDGRTVMLESVRAAWPGNVGL